VVHEIGCFESQIEAQGERCDELYERQRKIDQKLQDCLQVLKSLQAQLDQAQRPNMGWPSCHQPAASIQAPTAQSLLDLVQLISRQRELSHELEEQKRKATEEYETELEQKTKMERNLKDLAHGVRFGVSANVEGEYEISVKYCE